MNLQDYLTPKPAYLLHAWGGFWNDGLGAKLLGTDAHFFWFDSATEREIARSYINALAFVQERQDQRTVVFSEADGPGADTRTVAVMELELDRNRYPFVFDFGYGYPEESAYYMFLEGNYACDCNLSLFLSQSITNVRPYECGHRIAIHNFEVRQEP
jgi:hypothetical protein